MVKVGEVILSYTPRGVSRCARISHWAWFHLTRACQRQDHDRKCVRAMNPALRLRVRVDFAPGCSLGPGKVDLLEAIERCGSLSEGARQLGMSYRRAWLLLDELNHSFQAPLATTAIGGTHGGGAQLTDFGRDVIEAFRAVEREANTLARKRLSQLVPSSAVKGKTTAKVGVGKVRARSLARRKRGA